MKDIEEARKKLVKQKYGLVGKHSATQICLWTKNSLNGKGVCWKEKFYGIKSHRCAQVSVSLFNCQNKCLHCWRDTDFSLTGEVENPEDPKELIDKLIKERNKILVGYKGIVDKKKWEEASNPNFFTFSLTGEATLYPHLGEMIQELRKRKIITFLVTNGLNPGKLKELEEKKQLPTQITLSTNAPNEKLFTIWHRTSVKQVWKKFNETLDLMKKLKGKTRRVIRLTLVKEGSSETKFRNISNMKEKNVKEYSTLIRKAEPDFIHVKGFTSVGFARDRMGYDKMPWHKEVKDFASKLQRELKEEGYKILGEEERSCVVILGKSKKGMKITKV